MFHPCREEDEEEDEGEKDEYDRDHDVDNADVFPHSDAKLLKFNFGWVKKRESFFRDE